MATISIDKTPFAHGAFGDVHMAELGDSQQVTVKYVSVDMTEPATVTQLIRELRVLRSLRHPNLLSLCGVVHADSDTIGIVTVRYDMNLSKLVTVDSIARRKFVFGESRRGLPCTGTDAYTAMSNLRMYLCPLNARSACWATLDWSSRMPQPR